MQAIKIKVFWSSNLSAKHPGNLTAYLFSQMMILYEKNFMVDCMQPVNTVLYALLLWVWRSPVSQLRGK